MGPGRAGVRAGRHDGPHHLAQGVPGARRGAWASTAPDLPAAPTSFLSLALRATVRISRHVVDGVETSWTEPVVAWGRRGERRADRAAGRASSAERPGRRG